MTLAEDNSNNFCDRKKYRSIITSLKFAYFAYYCSVGCIHNFYPILLKKIHILNSQIGMLSSIGLIGGTISPVLIGYLADRTKKSRLILILISMFTVIIHSIPITTISIKLMANSKSNINPDYVERPLMSFVYMLYFFQFWVTFSDQGTKALLDGVVHKVLGECRKAGVDCDFAHLRMFGGVGIGIASFISGICLDHIKSIMPFGLPEELSLVVICVTMGTTLVIILILNVPDAETKEKVSFIGAVKNISSKADALICFLGQFFIQFGLNVTRHFDGLYIQYLGGNKTWIGISSFMAYIADVIMMYLSPTITHAIGSMEATICIGAFVAVLRSVIYGHADSKYMSLNNSILNGFSLGLIIPTMSSLLKSKAPENLISSYVSLLTATGKIGAAIASYIGGEISEKYSYTMIFIISSVFFGLAGLVIVVLRIFFSNESRSEKVPIQDASDIESFEISTKA